MQRRSALTAALVVAAPAGPRSGRRRQLLAGSGPFAEEADVRTLQNEARTVLTYTCARPGGKDGGKISTTTDAVAGTKTSYVLRQDRQRDGSRLHLRVHPHRDHVDDHSRMASISTGGKAYAGQYGSTGKSERIKLGNTIPQRPFRSVRHLNGRIGQGIRPRTRGHAELHDP
ncbi:hypothetical protein [Streptomyces sp. NPDC059258]|uniref:hypothetical protein n=1 Tax=unclassified Streptomyces TaxID=2593676 RepID=UPI0036C9CF48